MSDFGKPNLNVLTSTVYNGRYSGGIKKAICHQGLSSGGGGSKRKNFQFPFSHLVRETEESKGNLLSQYYQLQFLQNVRNSTCLLTGQSKPSFFVSQVSKASYLQYIFFFLKPIRRVIAISADRHLYCRAKRSQPCLWIMWCLECDCGPDGGGTFISKNWNFHLNIFITKPRI